MDSAVTDATEGAERMDTDGARAARGTVNQALLRHFLDEPYYRLPAPKSTGKELFHARYVADMVASSGGATSIDLDDLVATLTELTAHLVADATKAYGLDELVVAGGGVRNPTLMRRIAELSAPARVRLIDEFGLPAQGKEAYLFALLGYLSVHGLPGTIASATGASAGSILGSIAPGRTPLRLPEPAERQPRRMRVIASPSAVSDRDPVVTTMRPAHRADLPALAEVFVAAWRGGYHGVVPDDVIDAMDATVAETELAPSVDAADRTTLVALDADGDIVGFTIFGPDRDRDAGYLASLYVSPTAGGRGVGWSLLNAAVEGMPGVDITLWVFAGNVRARRLYERAGFHPDGTELTDPRWRAVQIRYRRGAGRDAGASQAAR